MARRVSALAVAALATAVVVAAGCRAPYTRDLEVLKARQARADLTFAVEQARAIHPNLYHSVSEADFRRAVDQANRQIHDRMQRRELALVLKELLAAVGDDHTGVDTKVYRDFLDGGGRTLPVRMAYDAGTGRARVTSVSPDCKSAHMHAGAEVTAIDGVAVAEWVARYRKYESHEDPRQRDAQVVGNLPALLWYDRGARDAFELRGVDAGGREWSEQVPAVHNWADTGNGGGGGSFPFAFYRGGDVCVMTARSFYYELDKEWDKSATAMLQRMGEKGTKLLVLDLRQNGGGDSGMGTGLLGRVTDRPFSVGRKDWRYSRAYQLACLRWGIAQRHIPSWLYLEYFVRLDRHLPPGSVDLTQLQGEWIHGGDSWVEPVPGGPWHGKVAVVVDGGTYSSGVDVAAAVKDNGLGLVAGDETGGRASFYSEVAPVGLPHSGILCVVASAHHMRPAGYDDGRGVLPDVPLEPGMPDEEVVAVLWEHLQSGNWPATRPATRPATSKIDTPVR